MELSAGERLDQARRFLTEGMWLAEFEPRTWTSRGVALLQFMVMVGEGFVRDQLLLRASALTYFAVLSIVPILVIIGAILTALGVTENVVGIIVQKFAAGTPDAQAQLTEIVQNAKIGRLGTVGAAALLLTTVLGISNIEQALNHIWGVKHQRSWNRRLPDYLAVLVVAPLLLGTALSLGTTVKSQWIVQKLTEYRAFELAYSLGLQQLPRVVMALAFAFLYWFLPNTSVRPVSAILGGVVAALLSDAALSLYVGSSMGVARANALFGGFAQIPLLFVWIYFFWAILLFGAEVAFAYQNLELYRREVRGVRPGPAECEAIGLRMVVEVGRSFRDVKSPWTADSLASAMKVPVRTVREILRGLQRAHIVAALDNSEKEDAFQLGRPAEQIGVLDVLTALRGPREVSVGDAAVREAVEKVLVDLGQGEAAALSGRTVADVIAGLPTKATSEG